jgi:hypothetical protein
VSSRSGGSSKYEIVRISRILLSAKFLLSAGVVRTLGSDFRSIRLHWFLFIIQKDAAGDSETFHVKIEGTDAWLNSAEAAIAGGPAETHILAITPELLREIPQRAFDPDHNPGDMVNILILGSQDEVVRTFTAAGWVHMDSSVQGTLISGVIGSLQKKD